MGEPPDALSARSNGQIRGRPSGHAWLVCLSNCLHGDHKQEYWSGKDSINETYRHALIKLKSKQD